MATEINKAPPAYEEVVALKRAQGQIGTPTDEPKPDTPFTTGSTGYNDPGHVNPALNPAPLWIPPERPAPVPVINDPGVIGATINLADLNKAATGVDYGQQDGAVTQDDIRSAAEERLRRLTEEAEGAGEEARRFAADMPRTESQNASGASKKGAKSGKASSRKSSAKKAGGDKVGSASKP